MSSQVPHIGMYKAAEHHPLTGWVFHQKYEILYLSWYSPKRNCTGTDVMVPKKTDSWDVKYLRNIVLLDSETNYTYKRIRRESMRAAIEYIQISTEQYNRPHRSALAHGINRILVFDYQQYFWQLFSLACSELKICYDRIVHSISRIELKHLGIPLPSIIRTLYTIQRM